MGDENHQSASPETWFRELRARLVGLEGVITAQIAGFKDLMTERDLRYSERDLANKEAVHMALRSVDKATDQTAAQLEEYKKANNEWRDTIRDLISALRESINKEEGSREKGESVKSDHRANIAIMIAFAGLLLVIVLRLWK